MPALVCHGTPGVISSSGPPRSCVRPRPSSIISSRPWEWLCQLDRLPAGNLRRSVRIALASICVGLPPMKLLCCAAVPAIISVTPPATTIVRNPTLLISPPVGTVRTRTHPTHLFLLQRPRAAQDIFDRVVSLVAGVFEDAVLWIGRQRERHRPGPRVDVGIFDRD